MRIHAALIALALAAAAAALPQLTVTVPDGGPTGTADTTINLPGVTRTNNFATTIDKTVYNTRTTPAAGPTSTTRRHGFYTSVWDTKTTTITYADGEVVTSTGRFTTEAFLPDPTESFTWTQFVTATLDPTPGAVTNMDLERARDRADELYAAMIAVTVTSVMLAALIGFPLWLWYHFTTVRREMKGIVTRRVWNEEERCWDTIELDQRAQEEEERIAIAREHAREAAAERDPAPAYTPPMQASSPPQYGTASERQGLLVTGATAAALGFSISQVPGARAAPVAPEARAWVTTTVLTSSRMVETATYGAYTWSTGGVLTTMHVPDATTTSTRPIYYLWSPQNPGLVEAANRKHTSAAIGLALGIVIPWLLVALCFFISCRKLRRWRKVQALFAEANAPAPVGHGLEDPVVRQV
ncbi:hypothetical protein Q8F55_007913 [Vanrija albida]|uniref:Uncharacterized protein n=1 Tax=Vanrija albida TaxID=181172 RepID=A0ABR3PVR4_9TREE